MQHRYEVAPPHHIRDEVVDEEHGDGERDDQPQYAARHEVLEVGTAGYCSPHHRMPPEGYIRF